MNVTDEMVECCFRKLTPAFSETMARNIVREILTAALSAAPEAVRVKTLEFIALSNESIAHTPFGCYRCGHTTTGMSTQQYQMVIAGCELPKSFHDTIEAAKAAAQSDYEDRIKSALEGK